jgi:tetratricopeptide (TPR) repeat protein
MNAGLRQQAEKIAEKLIHWLGEGRKGRSRMLADRLDNVLAQMNYSNDSIFVEGCISMICEARGDLDGAIKHRGKEVQLIKKLIRLSIGKPDWKEILDIYDYEDVTLRVIWLATLYHEQGELKKAIDALVRTKEFCARAGLRFDGEELLEEYLEESRQVDEANATPISIKSEPEEKIEAMKFGFNLKAILNTRQLINGNSIQFVSAGIKATRTPLEVGV